MISIDLFGILLIFVGALLLGSPVSLIAWIRPIRRWALSSRGARLGLLLMLATITFFLSYFALGRLVAESTYWFGTTWRYECNYCDAFGSSPTEEEQLNKTAIVNEIWLQYMFFPFVRGRCMTGRERICQLAAGLLRGSPPGVHAIDYLPLPGVGLGSGVVTALWASLITRSRRKTLDSKGGSTLAVQ